MLEYYFNGLGFYPGEWEKIRERLKENNEEYKIPEQRPQVMSTLTTAKSLVDLSGIPGMVRHYAMIRLVNDFSTEISFEMIGLFNLIDWSGMSLVKCQYNLEPFGLGFTVHIPFGMRESEFRWILEDWTVGVWFSVNIKKR